MKRLVVAAIVAMPLIAGAQQQNKPREVLSADGGRFVLGQIGEYTSSQYLLDTKTGRVWEVINVTDENGKTRGAGLRQIKFYLNDGRIWGDEPPPSGQTIPNR